MPPKSEKKEYDQVGSVNITPSGQPNKEDLNKTIDERALKLIKDYLKTSAFTDRKLTDTPTDANQVVSRKYVTLNGVSGSRPTASVLGQHYFDTTINKPIWWDGSKFIDAAGNTV